MSQEVPVLKLKAATQKKNIFISDHFMAFSAASAPAGKTG